jgi:hypothetical protein
MISCTEFIPAYNELFKYIEEKGNKAAVIDFWNYLSDVFLMDLRDEVVHHGILGCWNYWSKTLKEEAAEFTMELDEAAEEFSITMLQCPSKGRLLKEKQIKPYPGYCEHCDVLYRRVLEPLGFKYELDRSETNLARCRLTVRREKERYL